MSNEGILFNKYLGELIEWNKKFNLTSITDPAEIRKKHFADSLLLLEHRQLSAETVVDVGAGAGFPGLPLKLACPGIKLTLLEATKKKVGFLDHLIKTLGLTETGAVWARAEDFAAAHRESFDLAVARAVADLRVLAELCLPLVRVGGQFVAWKEVDIAAELAAAGPAIAQLGGRLREVKTHPQRSLVFLDKIGPTPAAFPRRTGLAKKRPL
ncbi:MAG TPA: 16S rRNA (guanine(527)-N(7))-methyltransferase RsmG [Candidatus Sulfotelmatobacter sp.]|nr:16S rRNA (guanine(527)-N(7))-methyltransferase RsmG [Candidatus Sulfotelmatobacter sp.]